MASLGTFHAITRLPSETFGNTHTQDYSPADREYMDGILHPVFTHPMLTDTARFAHLANQQLIHRFALSELK